MKEVMVSLSEVEDARDAKRKETSKLDADIDNLESKLAKLIAEKQNLARESSKTYKAIEKLNKKKERLEKTRDIEMEAYLEEKQAMKMEIESMYTKIDDLEENDNGTLEGSAAADTAAMIKFLEQIAAEKEKDLECPVREPTKSLRSNLFSSDLPRDRNSANFQLLGEPCDLLAMQTKVKHFVFSNSQSSCVFILIYLS